MIRTLVVDDSKFMRTLIADMLVSDPKIDVIATAKDGVDAVAMVRLHHPDVITLDVEMPRMDRLEALKAIMKENPTPVVMLSALTQEGADATLEALHHGAVDFVPKLSGSLSLDINKVKDLLISKIKAAALAKPERHLAPRLHRARTSFRRVTGKHVIAIGMSTGGPRALSELLPQFPGDISAGILIVQHMPPWFTKSLAERLDRSCAIRVKEAEVGDKIEDGQALITPGDYHTITEIPRLANEEEMVAGLFFELYGDTTDYIQLLFAQDSALALVDILRGREIGSTRTLSEMDESALMEIGNILTSAFATAWADFLGITLITSPPTLAFDMAGAVMDYVLATVGMVADQVILFKTIFEGGLNVFSGYFMLMPDLESLKNVLKMLGGQINE